MNIDYKAEVLEWMKDHEAGLVQPPAPLKMFPKKGWVGVTLPINGDDGNHIGCKVDLHDEFEVWHTLHTILRVEEWFGYNKEASDCYP